MSSPTQRSKKALEAAGYLVAVTEHWNAFARIRQDLYGFIDLLAVRENEILGVQTTSDANVSTRVKKIAEHENVGAVRKSGMRLEVHGWKKVKNRYVCRVIDVS